MKFKELSSDQRQAYQALLINIVEVKQQEEAMYAQQFYKLLVLGNGAGIVLLATFMGAVTSNAHIIKALLSPLILFSFGAVLAAAIYFPLMGVANQATQHTLRQVNEFFQNKLDLDQIQGYGFNKKGIFVLWSLNISSLVCFSIGLYLCVESTQRFFVMVSKCMFSPHKRGRGQSARYVGYPNVGVETHGQNHVAENINCKNVGWVR